MKRIFLLAFLFLSLTIYGDDFTGTVIAVLDGDTIRVVNSTTKEEIKIRMFGIDAPEKAQSFGVDSKKYLSDKILNKVVTVSVKNTDMYGRSVGIIYLKKTNINILQVKEGNAWWYKAYDKKDKDTEAAEELAKELKKGLWKDLTPKAPWIYRREIKSKNKSSLDEK